MKHPTRRRLMYLAFQGLRAAIQVVPLAVARSLGAALGLIAYGLLRGQRRLTHAHLSAALGQSLTAAERRRIARGVFVNLGRNIAEWLRLPALSGAQIQQLVVCEGLQRLRAALAKGDGAIVVTAHFGNWELIAPYLKTQGFEGAVLARRLRYPEYESFLIGMRGAKGVPTLARGSLKEVAKLLRANQVVGLLPDQDVDSLEGVFVDFFGRPAYTPVGPAALSLMTGSPILPCFIIREGARFRLIIEDEVRIPPTADRAQAAAALTQAWSQVVESYIRRYPDHWVWMHRRWKTQPRQATSNPATPLRAGKQRATGEDRAPLVNRADVRLGQPLASACLVACCLLLVAAFTGCAKKPAAPPPKSAGVQTTDATQQMKGFTLTGYETTGAKRWELEGERASLDGNLVTIFRPDAVGFDPSRTAYLTASVAQVNQTNRHVRLEHDVTIHTSDGLWFTAPVLHWIPDQEQMATDTPVRLETDHMLLRGRGAIGQTQLKQATILKDIELVLNPSDHDVPSQQPKQVTITCDGPLSFDYEHNVATFEQNVHVQDPQGDLYSDKLIAYLNEATHTIRYAEAIGRVRIHQNQNTALSERAVYEPANGKITLVGKPSLLIYPSDGGGNSPALSLGGLADATATR